MSAMPQLTRKEATGLLYAYRYMRVVNTDDIVCRMPPPQVSPPPWYAGEDMPAH